MKLNVWLSAAIAASFGFAVFAHSGATGIVKERMDGMVAMGDAIKTITPMMRGQVTYFPQDVRAFAEEVRKHSGGSMTRLFPEGSGGKPSEAKPTVWTDWEDFQELADQLHLLSEGLVEAADNGLAVRTGNGNSMMTGGSMMGGQSMMGSQAMMGAGSMMNDMGIEELAEMPADSVFMMISQTCSACHTKFRAESK